MAIDWIIKRHDTFPPYQYQMLDRSGEPYNLAGCVVAFHLVDPNTGAILVDSPAFIQDHLLGMVMYDWQPGDTATAGEYAAEWQITHADGRIRTYPNGGNLRVLIYPDLL